MASTRTAATRHVLGGVTRCYLPILLLSVAGGGVDAIMILGFQVLTGAQTGNTVMLAVALAEGRFAAGFYSAVSVAAYVIGAVVGQLVILKRKSVSSLPPFGRALVAELIPICTLPVCWHFASHTPGPKMTTVLVALAAIGMGIQSAAVLRLHGGATTTYVTGTLITFATEITGSLFLSGARAHSESPEDHTGSSALLPGNRRVLYGLDWLVYLGGAVASGLLFLSVRETALLLPILAVTAVIIAGRVTRFGCSG